MPNSTIASASTTASWRGTPWRDWVGLVARVVLGIVMIVAGALKVTNLPSSVLAVRAYKLLQYDLAGAVGYALPFIEITVGLLLVLGVFTRVAAAVNGLLMVAFIIGISWAWAHGYSLDCGCFGGGGEIERAKALASYPWEIARDIGLLALAVWLVVRPTTPYSLENRLFGPVTVSDDDLDEELHS